MEISGEVELRFLVVEKFGRGMLEQKSSCWLRIVGLRVVCSVDCI